ncbi:MAG TPA: hypothetical protein VHB20_19055 [Verrucomicrobiae bacterium]|jgi:hypothetical protein|nr:hypothetical protein [Verrucomicrobiae bacterium]
MQRVLEFLKRHYEKIILGLALMCLAAAGVLLPKQVEDVKAQISAPPAPAGAHEPPMTPLNVAPLIAAMQRVTNPPPLVLSGDHNLFNPVVWKRKSNGDFLKILKTGADALTVTNIVTLYQRIGLDHPSGGGFYMFVQTQSGKKAVEYVKLNEKSKSGLYIVRAIKGTAEDPSQLQLEILETGEKVWITPKAPFERPDAHVADLRYDPEALNLPKKKVNDTFTLDGEQYKIVAITNGAVTVQQSTTTKQTTIPWSGNSGSESRP